MKRVGLICLALVLTLGVLGVGYAMWWDEVKIEGTVNTGTVRVEIVDQKSNDPAGSLDPAGGHTPLGDGAWGNLFANNTPPNASGNWTWFGTVYEKDVALCECDFGADWMTMSMYNVYPSYGPDVAFAVQNLGTVPVNICGIKLVSVTTPQGTFPMNVDVDSNYNNTVYMVANNGTVTAYSGPFGPGFDDDYAFSIVLTSIGGVPLLGVQIDPGMGVLGDVGIHIAQSAVQSENYSFTLKYMFCQWDE
jgi:hypothetical protein